WVSSRPAATRIGVPSRSIRASCRCVQSARNGTSRSDSTRCFSSRRAVGMTSSCVVILQCRPYGWTLGRHLHWAASVPNRRHSPHARTSPRSREEERVLELRMCGGVEVEVDGRLLPESTIGGRQGRLVLAYLACARDRAVRREELADLLWPEQLPESWTASLSAVVSRLRRLFTEAGLARPSVVVSTPG